MDFQPRRIFSQGKVGVAILSGVWTGKERGSNMETQMLRQKMQWTPVMLLMLFFHQISWASVPPTVHGELLLRIPREKAASPKLPLQNMTHDTIWYILGLFVADPLQLELQVDENSQDQDWVQIPASAIYPPALPHFTKWGSLENYLDVMKELKNYLKTSAPLNARHLKHPEIMIPKTVKELRDQWSYYEWPTKRVEYSLVKGKPRLLYRSTKQPISISETLESRTDTNVRETEVIIEREDGSGQFDFFAYDKLGRLSHLSIFQSKSGMEVKGPVPHTCMTCHYDGNRRVFQRLPLSFAGGN